MQSTILDAMWVFPFRFASHSSPDASRNLLRPVSILFGTCPIGVHVILRLPPRPFAVRSVRNPVPSFLPGGAFPVRGVREHIRGWGAPLRGRTRHWMGR
eukprot:scaffold616_cov306-Pavlova_lutheri.AAC.21